MTKFALLVTIRVVPEAADRYLARIRAAAAAAVRDEEHCLRFEVAQDEADPSVFVLFEVYTNREALAFHHTTPHFKACRDETADWVVDKSSQRLVLHGAD